MRTAGEHDPEGCFTQQPDTPHKRKWALKKKGAHNPTGASNPEHGAVRTTKGVRTTGEHDQKWCFTQKPDAPHENKWALKRRGAQPKASVNPRKPGGAHNQKRAHDRGARPRRVLHPATRHAAQEKVGTKEKGAHNPTGALNPEHGAARTTKGVCPTGEHFR